MAMNLSLGMGAKLILAVAVVVGCDFVVAFAFGSDGVILSVLIFGIATILHDLTGLTVVAAAGGGGVVAGELLLLLLLLLLLVLMGGVLMLLLV